MENTIESRQCSVCKESFTGEGDAVDGNNHCSHQCSNQYIQWVVDYRSVGASDSCWDLLNLEVESPVVPNQEEFKRITQEELKRMEMEYHAIGIKLDILEMLQDVVERW